MSAPGQDRYEGIEAYCGAVLGAPILALGYSHTNLQIDCHESLDCETTIVDCGLYQPTDSFDFSDDGIIRILYSLCRLFQLPVVLATGTKKVAAPSTPAYDNDNAIYTVKFTVFEVS